MLNRCLYTLLVSALACSAANAQSGFVENRGQWLDDVLFRSEVQGGSVFFSDRKLTYSFYNTAQIESAHDERLHSATQMVADNKSGKLNCFAYSVEFVESENANVTGGLPYNYKFNYFLGNDSTHWASDVKVYANVNYNSLYAGIDAVFFKEQDQLKYNFQLEPGADPSLILMRYSGVEGISLQDDALVLDMGFTEIREIIPAAYQEIEGKRYNVQCNFNLDGNTVSFVFPEGYNTGLPLIIDPVLVAATYSGSTGETFGFTATYDEQGNIYTGGLCLETGFPVTLGAYDVSFDSLYDLGISKFNPTGTTLLYCTYIGGALEEYPLSMYEFQGTLNVYGSTTSPDFPTTSAGFDQTHNGSKDIYVFNLNSNGSALLGSTFVGGSADDGGNFINVNFSDGFRGEIVVDNSGAVYVVSSSSSSGFPVTPGAFSTVNAGAQDAVVFKMNSSLSVMIWATFLGSSLNDAGFGIRVDPSGFVYVCGTDRGIFGDFPTTAGSYQPIYQGGAEDAFVAKFDPSGSVLVACTFFGGPGVDLGYFLDLDRDGNVYITGIATMGVPMTNGSYSVPGSSNFIAKFDGSLSSLLFSTVYGDGTSLYPVVPYAFMVDECERIYICGFGGSSDWPITSDGLYSFAANTVQCYLVVFEENATSMLYATFYSSWHVDGGTSRFDPKGIVYQAVCQGGPGFPTTPGAFSDGTNPPPWDICVLKMDFQIEQDSVILPNIFTPNSDNINDLYDVGLKSVRQFNLQIYNRWGAEVFSSGGSSVMWDGTSNGRYCPDGVYFVVLEHGYCSDQTYTTTGFVHLIRYGH
jgi:gliding motility-associated-like protein